MKSSIGTFLHETAFEANGLRKLSQDEMRHLQMGLLGILKDIIQVCNKFDFCYMLLYGSTLGAVRHRGFIPWDDDLDIGILRKDYVSFLETFKKEYGRKYEVEYPDEHNAEHFMGRIYLKEHGILGLCDLSNPFITCKGIFLDVFPLENMPNNILKYKLYGIFFDKLLYFSHFIPFYKSHSIEFEKYNFDGGKRKFHYQMKLVLGYILSIIPYRKWIIFYDRLVSSVQESKYIGTPVADVKHYFKGRLNKDILLPTNIGYFEGEKVALPNNYHEYLRNTYGDYMKIPDVVDRKMHFAIRMMS